jgi:YVTN family beta-propeller protein
MDETELRDFFRGLGDTEQPAGAVDLAGIRIQGRRRLRRRQAGITAGALAAVAVPVLIGTTLGQGHMTRPATVPSATGPSPARVPVAYVVNGGSQGTVTPINTATNTPGRVIKTGHEPFEIAITPNGKTAYVTNLGSGTITPIDTALKPIDVGGAPGTS